VDAAVSCTELSIVSLSNGCKVRKSMTSTLIPWSLPETYVPAQKGYAQIFCVQVFCKVHVLS
jgi:hypothetical protein